MAADADRLDSAASALSDAAWRVEDSIRRLSDRVAEQVVHAYLGWKGPAADRFWWATQDRVSRMRRVQERMRAIADQMRREAWAIRQEEQTKMKF